MISDYRLQIISSRVSNLHKEFKIAEFPIKMPHIFKEHYSNSVIMKRIDMNGKVDIVANHDIVHDITALIINKRRTSPSQHKRLNFSLAHELGHIVLEHYRSYSNTNNNEIDYLEEEADEFAGQFLVPDMELMKRPYDIKLLSDYFFVSSAVIQKRHLRLISNNKNQIVAENNRKLDDILDRYLFDF